METFSHCRLDVCDWKKGEKRTTSQKETIKHDNLFTSLRKIAFFVKFRYQFLRTQDSIHGLETKFGQRGFSYSPFGKTRSLHKHFL